LEGEACLNADVVSAVPTAHAVPSVELPAPVIEIRVRGESGHESRGIAFVGRVDERADGGGNLDVRHGDDSFASGRFGTGRLAAGQPCPTSTSLAAMAIPRWTISSAEARSAFIPIRACAPCRTAATRLSADGSIGGLGHLQRHSPYPP